MRCSLLRGGGVCQELPITSPPLPTALAHSNLGQPSRAQQAAPHAQAASLCPRAPPWMPAREAAWPLALIKPQKSLKLEARTCRCKCMAYKPWAHFWARGEGGHSGCSPYPRARFSHLCVPRATLPAFLPPPACALQVSMFVKHLLCVLHLGLERE